MRSILRLCLILVSLLPALAAHAQTDVVTTSGTVHGAVAGSVIQWLGIPYAEPPARWTRSVPKVASPTLIDATTPKPACVQLLSQISAECRDTVGQTPGTPVGSEDCLTLSIWKPVAAPPTPRPVMVWIHGGSLNNGCAKDGLTTGGDLALHGAEGGQIVVAIQYRLGPMGFFALEELASEDPAGLAGNYGMLDMVLALEWVQDNIAAFGGDPDNVTIFGESAGGMSVGTLLGCPQAQGLFHKAVPQSGSTQAIHDHESAASVAAAILSGLGLESPNVQKLREVPAETLVQVQQAVSMRLLLAGGAQLLPFQPVVDGRLLPRHPLDQIRDGLAREVRVLIGTTRDEWRLFGFTDPQLRQLDAAQIAERIAQRLPHADGAKIVAGYRAARPDADWASIWLAIETDRVFRIPAIRTAEAQLRHQPGVYAYLFTWESPGFGGLLGACHAIEIPFLFGCLDLPGAESFVGKGPEAERLAERTMDAWIAFARSGDPSHPGLGEWPRYDTEKRWTMELGAHCGARPDPSGAERALWEGVL